MKVKYTLLHNDKNTKARYGTLETNYGKFETPMFMPCLLYTSPSPRD